MSIGHGKTQRQVIELLKEGPLTTNEMVAVIYNGERPASDCNSVMAWHTNRSAITRSLRKLVSEGWVERVGRRTESGFAYRLVAESN